MVIDQIRAPEHLLSYSWLELEKDQALRIFSDLEKIVGKLDKKLTEKRVHDVRVVLRRWYSVWDILAVDGWEDAADSERTFEKKIGRHLKKLIKSLGQLRDLDVSIALARDLHINQFIVKKLSKERRKANRRVRKKIAKLKLAKLIGRIKDYLADKSDQLSRLPSGASTNLNGGGGDQSDNGQTQTHTHTHTHTHKVDIGVLVLPEVSAYFHMDQFLQQSEHQCRLLCDHNRSNDELHELRLSIKRWRYLLTEFFGLTNLELVRAQQILGRIRDFNRLNDDIERLKLALAKATAKNRLTAENLKADKDAIAASIEEQFLLLGPVLEALPFGLRPYLLSF
jgi:CHAD domain-containing protein